MSNREPLIRDIPSIKKMIDQMRRFARFKRAMPVLRPLLRLLGANTVNIDEAMAGIDDLAVKAEEFARIPDRFNDLFAEKGWIIYDRMSLEVAKAAILQAEDDDFEQAEATLVAYYDAETVRWGVMAMHAVEAFRPRMRLAEKALEDYETERYHACVPVVLALIDGMVNELHQKAHGRRRGISAEGVDLTAWDSLAAHSRGLARLIKIFQRGRHRTNAEPITLPYRNGILHGIDLGYDNRTVAAKTWAALFAAREWALKVERGEVAAPPEPPEKNLRDHWTDLQQSVRRWQAVEADRARLKTWKARKMEIGVDIPTTGAPESFTVGTPEHKLAEYLALWSDKNYGGMAKCLSPFLGPAPRKAPAEVRSAFATKRLIQFDITGIRDEAPAISEIDADLLYFENGEEIRRSHTFRIICGDAEGRPAMRGAPYTSWAIVSWAIW